MEILVSAMFIIAYTKFTKTSTLTAPGVFVLRSMPPNGYITGGAKPPLTLGAFSESLRKRSQPTSPGASRVSGAAETVPRTGLRALPERSPSGVALAQCM